MSACIARSKYTNRECVSSNSLTHSLFVIPLSESTCFWAGCLFFRHRSGYLCRSWSANHLDLLPYHNKCFYASMREYAVSLFERRCKDTAFAT